MVEIYHNPDFLSYYFDKNPIDINKCELMALLETDCLDEAWRMTQNIDSDWRPYDPCRSSSVGDVFVKDGVKYVVESCGFSQI